MNVTVIGTGYVGLVTGACFSEFGVQVTCADKDVKKIERLQEGEIPIYEPGLEDIVVRNQRTGTLAFTSDTAEAIRSSLVIFIAVGTPAAEDGSTDLRFIESVAREIGQNIDGYKVIVTKSTVPVGTAAKVRAWVEEEAAKLGRDAQFSVASNPEFLREGAAVGDFMRPDRVVIGTAPGDQQANAILKDLYRPLYLNETPFVLCGIETAELSKYAANAFLATKISFINEVADLCERVGGDVQAVARAMGLDKRIGSKFLHAGPGFGGSCFPKDTLSAAHFARELGTRFEIVESVIGVNKRQRSRMVEKISEVLDGRVEGRTIAVLGLAFKPETDDMREAPAVDIIEMLVDGGASIRAYDPVAMDEARAILPQIELCKDAYSACEGADALVIVTEWNQFRALDFERVKAALRQPVLIDLRNIYDPRTDARRRLPVRRRRAMTAARKPQRRSKRSASAGQGPRRSGAPRIHAVVLAGGAGERFWPASRRHHPKPFLRVVGGTTLLDATLSRARAVVGGGARAAERVWVVCGCEHAAAVRRESGLPRSRVLVEPERRNTAMACAWAALRIQAEDPDAVLVIMPADHHVPDEKAFAAAAATAAAAARDEGWLVTLGIEPTRPDTGYGYIHRGEALPRPHAKLALVQRFEEKPSRQKALRYLARSDYYWNAGVFVWSASRFLEELAACAPNIHAALAPMRARPRSSGGRGVGAAYAAAPSEAVDVAVMEKSRRVATLPVRFAWSDVGTWASLAEELGVGDPRPNGGGADGNRVIAGDLLAEDAHGNLVWGGERLVALLGVEGLAVIDSDDVILVTNLGRSQDVKRLVSRLKADGRAELT